MRYSIRPQPLWHLMALALFHISSSLRVGVIQTPPATTSCSLDDDCQDRGYAVTAAMQICDHLNLNNKVKCCDGVDLNRNFNHSFGGASTSLNTCNDKYLGTGPFSEPETQAVRDFVLRNAKNMKAFITIHAHAQMWFYPYADRNGSYPEDIQELVALSKKAVQAIKKPYGTEMKIGTPAEILYPASGSSFDWVKSVAKVKYCFAIELRPSRDHVNGFVLPTSNIVPAGEETWAGISVVADEVIKNFAS